jgi:hypothetical protein
MVSQLDDAERRKNPAYDPDTGEWVFDRNHRTPVFTPRRATEALRPTAKGGRLPVRRPARAQPR